MFFNEFINSRRKELGMSIDDLVRESGVPKGTLSKITSGINTNPTLSTVEAICKALHCTLNDAIGIKDCKAVTNAELGMIKKHRALDEYGKKAVDDLLETEYNRCLALLTSVEQKVIIKKIARLAASAGTGDYLDGEEYEKIALVRTPEAEQADFAVRVNGDSMEDTYFDDDILLVESTPHINVGDIGVFIVNGEGYVKEFGGDRLISHNDKYQDILLHDYDMVFCSGRVIGVGEKA
ncbi:MAG: helix-turn-helix domain-containing protein [Oscillospiraceae bacterium]|nr:helix-turn-helix domain-containing protein [Oscillospiraceae bacterium]